MTTPVTSDDILAQGWPLRVDEELWTRATGEPPIEDDLETANCPKAGAPGHRACGWCEHDKPVRKCEACFAQSCTAAGVYRKVLPVIRDPEPQRGG